MRFKFCPDCGEKLVLKPIGDEGETPYCEGCKKPLFDMFPSCVIVLVENELGELLLLTQNYISMQHRNLVSGYIKPGESAEETAVREVKEEVGMDLLQLRPAGTFWFDKKDMLMIGFFATAKKCEPKLSGEVNAAEWVTAERALEMVHPSGCISHTVIEGFLAEKAEGNKSRDFL